MDFTTPTFRKEPKKIGSHHQNVAERILANEDWEAYAIREIEEIRKEMDGVQ